MKKPSYKRELSHSYLVLEEIPKEYQNSYQYKMILRNRIPGLLASSERRLEGKTSLYYDISSKQSLAQLYLSEQIRFQALRGMVDNLVQVQDSIAEYLLEENGLVLDPEYIYMDLESEQLFFLYDPMSSGKESEAEIYRLLTEFFLEHVDHREKEAMSAAYQFYRMAKVKSFTIGSFRACLERGVQEDSFAGKRREAEAQEGGLRQGSVYGNSMLSKPENILLTDQEGTYECRRDGRNGSVRDMSGKPEPERTADMARKGRAYLEEWEHSGGREQEGLYKDYEDEEWQEEDEIEDEGEEERHRSREKRSKKGSMTGLVLSALFFLGLCALIWYLAPSGQQKIILFAALAADGLSFLIFLWLVTGEREPDAEPGQEEREVEKEPPLWGEYEEADEDGFGGPTVYLGSICKEAEESEMWKKEEQPRLIGQVGGKEKEYSLGELPALAGKMKGRVQLLIPDASVSRIHARFSEMDGKTVLMDMNSTNGTYVNDIRLEPEEMVALETGDEIRLGDVRMQYTT